MAEPPSLPELRAEIDRIDAAMHELLIERGEIIDRLISVKRTSQSGAAFRPGREAAMMRLLAARHRGLLPLDTVEGIWRVIIATFTYLQAPFAVHADISGGDAPMRDAARFHFGFTVPYRPHPSAPAVMEAVALSRGDLGLLRIDQGASAGAWWDRLAGPGRPQIIARLPFIERADHPAATPVFVLARPLDDPSAQMRDVVLFSARFDRWREAARGAVEARGGEIVASAGTSQGLAVLLAVPGDLDARGLTGTLAEAGSRPADLVEIGSHAERFRVASPPVR